MENGIWTYYDITWTFLTKLCASVPKDPELIKAWLEARKPTHAPPSGKSIDEIQEEVFESLPQQAEEPKYSSLVFQRHNGSLVLRAATVKAHMKDCARQISSLYVGRIKGERSFATKIINGVYPDESQYWIEIQRPNGYSVTQADGSYDKPVHAIGPGGVRLNSIKNFEFVEPAKIEFSLKVLGDCIKEKDLYTLFDYGGVHGYGGERGDGEGKYTAQVLKI